MPLDTLRKSFSEMHGLARVSLWILPSIAILAASILVWTLEHRLEGYGFRLTPYPTIYMPHGIPIITGFEYGANTLTMELTSPGLVNQINTSSGEALRKTAELTVTPGLTNHRLTGIDFAQNPGLGFSTILAEGFNEVVFSSSEVHIGRFRQFPLDKLTASVEDFPNEDIKQAHQILDGANISPSDSYELKFQKVWQFLDSQLAHAHGAPPDNFERQPALTQYKMAIDGKAKLWCSNFAGIFALFGTAVGLNVRVVDAIRLVDEVVVSAHVFNEVFFPDLGRWAYVDLSLRAMSIMAGPNGPPMNTIQLAQLHQAGATDGLSVIVQKHDDIHAIPYSEFTEFLGLHITANATYIFHTVYKDRYSLRNLVKRYLIDPEPAHALHGSNRPHLIKMSALWVMILSASAWIILVLYLHLDRKRIRA